MPIQLFYRYRFTAGYLQELMLGIWEEGHPMSPHKLLNEYVRVFADYYPIDGDKTLLDAEPMVAGSLGVARFTWERLQQGGLFLQSGYAPTYECFQNHI
jgi:hypothetical protein